MCREPNVLNYLGTPYLLQRPVRYALGDIVDVRTSRAGKAITGALSLRIIRKKIICRESYAFRAIAEKIVRQTIFLVKIAK